MTNLVKLTQANAARWDKASILPEYVAIVTKVAARLSADAAKVHYVAVSAKTGVPWAVIAVIHEREASQSWKGNLAQGDPYNERSIHVPAGRGPFGSWNDAAVDALTRCSPFAARWKDWSIGGALTLLETYNGLGYANGPAGHPPMPSPYVWAATNQQTLGKYVSDGHFDSSVMDHQLGCAALLKAIFDADPAAQWAKMVV